MKRTIVGVALVAGVVQLTGTPAQAASKIDPVKVLQTQLARGKAVNVRSTAKVAYTSSLVATSTLEGTIGFGPGRAVASDVAQTVRYSKALLRTLTKTRPKETEALQQGPIRMISSEEASYVAGPVVDAALPPDTSWVRYRSELPPSNLLLEVLEPATLKTLLAARTSAGGGVVKGSVKASRLAKVSPAFAALFSTPPRAGRDGSIAYTLWFSPDGLIERVSAKAVLPLYVSTIRVESDTRFSDWGREATVLLPMEGDVIDQKEVEADVPKQVPGIWN
ncbi:hypothetical protein [Nonomuraea sp. NPDC050643]|uniref:hypothetical protein n=1 Tax=Nonomuraea sp. NPDC050643 TaxID=3155660 RepID=UPI0033F28A95